MKIQITENQLKKLVAESVALLLNEAFGEASKSEETPEDAKRREIDAAWEEFDNEHNEFIDKMRTSQDWMDYMLNDYKKETEIEDAWNEHDGISPRHI